MVRIVKLEYDIHGTIDKILACNLLCGTGRVRHLDGGLVDAVFSDALGTFNLYCKGCREASSIAPAPGSKVSCAPLSSMVEVVGGVAAPSLNVYSNSTFFVFFEASASSQTYWIPPAFNFTFHSPSRVASTLDIDWE